VAVQDCVTRIGHYSVSNLLDVLPELLLTLTTNLVRLLLTETGTVIDAVLVLSNTGSNVGLALTIASGVVTVADETTARSASSTTSTHSSTFPEIFPEMIPPL
jgi:hypothetical protein